jgi:integrase
MNALSSTGRNLQCWLNEHPEYRSEWYRRCVISSIKRAFNWALEMELIQRNPFAKMRSRGRPQRRRPMTDDEFQTLLRGSDPTFRRLLIFLKFTGCRPGEAASMRWPDVHCEEGAVVLKEHKTAGKTGRPRVIPLVRTVTKLLHWMYSQRQASSRCRDQEHVFTNGRGNSFSRGWLSLKVQRLRARLGLSKGVTLYGLRHRYGLMGIKNGVNLKLLSLCMGHARTHMTEHYIAEAGLTDQPGRLLTDIAASDRGRRVWSLKCGRHLHRQSCQLPAWQAFLSVGLGYRRRRLGDSRVRL